eukprot:GILK01002218.1.p1 GENE.GILK01002218.1~~GILK01002218.1.p1  ORF type:complete len:798 (-),score=158.56 GILK01002218.1:119-2200(-)
MAYGQTGAGKTFSMVGGTQNYKYRGLIPRAIGHVFQEVQAKPESAITVRISYIEIYNEVMYDLLSAIPPGEATEELLIQDDHKGGVHVKGLSMPVANNEEEALNMFFEGETNRTISEHLLNKSSTRSHCIFTIHIESRSRVESSEKVTTSKLNLVDLAGSERVKKTGSEGLTLKEATYINKSLTFLEQVVIALSNRNRDHIPYRQSKLTNVLRDSLGGNCKTLMIANIWPEPTHVEETSSTLKFATRMLRISNEATINVQLDPQLLIKKYEREIRELKQELAMHDTLAGRSRIQYEEYTPEQQYEVQQLARKYLRNEVEELEADSMRQVKELFTQMRLLYKNVEMDVREKLRRDFAESGQNGFGGSPENTVNASSKQGASRLGTATSASAAPHADVNNNEVGDDDPHAGGFTIGRAAADARPAVRLRPGREEAVRDTTEEGRRGDTRESVMRGPIDMDGSENRKRDTFSGPSRQEAFVEFKQTFGAELNEALLQNKSDLKAKKLEAKALTAKANDAKKAIDSVKEAMDSKKKEKDEQADDAEGELIDEEEYAQIRKLRELKKDYRDAFDALKMIKSDLVVIEHNIEQVTQRLVLEFEDWFNKTYHQDTSPMDDIRGAEDENVGDQDVLDDGEKFDRMELARIEQEDPDAVAFYNARKKVLASKRTGQPAGLRGTSQGTTPRRGGSLTASRGKR